MEPIYSNFDGLDVSFQCAASEDVLNILAEAKKKAQETKSDSVVKIGKNNKVVTVSESGCRGGYHYCLDTGFDGETWFIAHSKKRDLWNVRVSVKSLALAMYGYSMVKERIMNLLLNDIQAMGAPRKNKLTGEIIDFPLERISRIDFCIDFKTPEFIPDIACFVGKGRYKKKILISDDNKKDTCEIIFSGRNAKYFRIGSMPNRQVVLYDKISDIIEKKKYYWWDIWGIKKSGFNGQIWRIEARAGKKELNNWNLRRFSDFEKMAGDVISGILNDIKYVIPSETDKNISRWPKADFWEDAIKIAKKKLQNNISNAQRKMIIEGYINQISDQFEKSILGRSVSYAALHDMDISEMPSVLDILGETIIKRIKNNPDKFQEKHEKMTDKYSQLKE